MGKSYQTYAKKLKAKKQRKSRPFLDHATTQK
jgi:hypothetical protein